MSNYDKQSIHEVNFLGFKLYERIRLEEHQIEIVAQKNISEYTGLLTLSKEPEIKYSSLSASYVDWKIIAHQTIELTLIDLIINEFVELIAFTDEKHYVSGLIKHEYKNYRFAAKKDYSGSDYLSGHIVQSIKDTEEKDGKKANLQKVIQVQQQKYLKIIWRNSM